MFKIDIVIETTGLFLTYKTLKNHIFSGAKKVIITTFPKDNIPIFFNGINKNFYINQNIIASISYVVYFLISIIKIIHYNFNIVESIIVILSNFNNKDFFKKDFFNFGNNYKYSNMNYFSLIKIIYKVIPEIKGKIKEVFLRVPILNFSIIDFTLYIKKKIYYNFFYKVIKKFFYIKFKNLKVYINGKLILHSLCDKKNTSIIYNKVSISLNNKFIKLLFYYNIEKDFSYNILNLINYIYNYNI